MLPDVAVVEVEDLRRSLRDVLALTALPALWRGQSGSRLLEGLAAALHAALQADGVYARLGPRLSPTEGPVTCNVDGPGGVAFDQALAATLREWEVEFGHGPGAALPFLYVGRPDLPHVALIPLGRGGGVLAAGPRRSNFPTERERLLLPVAVNLATTSLECNHAEATPRVRPA